MQNSEFRIKNILNVVEIIFPLSIEYSFKRNIIFEAPIFSAFVIRQIRTYSLFVAIL